MIYLIDGKETYFLNKKKQELIASSNVSEENILTMDASTSKNFNMADALAYCDTISLFDEKRIVILDQPYFLKAQSGQNKKDKETQLQLFEKYTLNPNEFTDLILYCYGYDADKRTKEYQILSKQFGKTVTHIHFGEFTPKELDERVKQELKNHGYTLTNDAYQELRLRIGNHVTGLYQALEKFDLYEKKDLNLEDIIHLVPSNTEVDIWKLGNAFLANKPDQVLKAYRDLVEVEKMTPLGIIPILASQLRGIYNSLKCYEEGMNEYQIKDYTGRFYPNLDIQSAGEYQSKDILRLLKELADIDQGVKAGKLSDKDSFEYFLMRNMKHAINS